MEEEFHFFICRHMVYSTLLVLGQVAISVTVLVEYRVQVHRWLSAYLNESSLYCLDILFTIEASFYRIVRGYDYMLRSHYSSRSFHFTKKWITISPVFKVMC